MSDKTLTELIHGKGAHADVILSVKGLTAAQAARVVPSLPHSIWQIVSHMNYWMRYEFSRIAGNPEPYPVTASVGWPPVPEPAAEISWQNEVEKFERNILEMNDLAKGNPDTLEREVEHTSVRGRLWQLVAHNSYHIGQVVFLRHAMGLWPPPKGSDTW